MEKNYREMKGTELVKYVADATEMDEDQCRESLEFLIREEIDSSTNIYTGEPSISDDMSYRTRGAKRKRDKDQDVKKLEGFSKWSVDGFLKNQYKKHCDRNLELDEFMERTCQVLGFARSLNYQNYLIINDPIHGTIELHPLLVEIIDQPLFQRLRHIKQLGGVSYVYPGATHTRFEHSIGVCHLAGEVMRNLKTKQPELGITEQDVLCVEIAGLCHDLGHGPFSHMFEWAAEEIHGNWKHENVSSKVLEDLAEKLKDVFERFGLNADIDIPIRVKRMIEGGHGFDVLQRHEQQEAEERHYLFTIVANKNSGCDVDKWDYYARDCHYLGIPCDFDISRFVKSIRVATETKDQTKLSELCFRDKEVNNVYGMFHTRGVIHLKALQHKTSQVVQHMMCEALIKVKDVPLLRVGERQLSLKEILEVVDDKDKKISESGWSDLDDRFLFLIKNAETRNDEENAKYAKELQEARDILENIEKREIYKFIGSARVKEKKCKHFHEAFKTHEIKTSPDELLILMAVISQSSESKTCPSTNPVYSVKFYKKGDPTTVVGSEFVKLLGDIKPTVFSETRLQVYNKAGKEKNDACWRAFENWTKNQRDVKGVLEDFDRRYPGTSNNH